jgi:Protein of unknown function (DUF1329).
MTIKNAATGELVDDGEGVANVAEGFPFPILDADPAKAGMEAIWNHKLKYKGVSFARWNNQVTPTSPAASTCSSASARKAGPVLQAGQHAQGHQ